MTNEEFMDEVEKSYLRSLGVFKGKDIEYGTESNRLHQFYDSAKRRNTNPCDALIGVADKHYSSILLMVKNPNQYSLKEWDAKVTDLRNYTFLLDALLREMR